MTPEEKIASSICALNDTLATSSAFTYPIIKEIVIAATPEITKHYLKGQ